jgi:hypothetical protein
MRKFFVYRLDRIIQTRTFKGTQKYRDIEAKVDRYVREAVTMIREFWRRVSVGDKSLTLGTINQIRFCLERARFEAVRCITIFPDDSTFLSLYALFKNECLANIESGVRFGLRASDYLSGEGSVLDPLLKRFCLARPEVLAVGLLCSRGDLSCSTSGRLVTDEDNDGPLISEAISEKFQWPFLRSALYRGTSHFVPRFWEQAWQYHNFVYFAWALAGIVAISLMDLLFGQFRTIYARCNQVVVLRAAIDRNFLHILLGWGEATGNFNSALFPPTKNDLALNFLSLYDSHKKWSREAANAFAEALRLLEAGGGMEKEELEVFFQSALVRRQCYSDSGGKWEVTGSFESTLKDTIGAMIWRQKEFLIRDVSLCEMYFWQTQITNMIDIVSVGIGNDAWSVMDIIYGLIIFYVVLIAGAATLLGIPGILFPHYLLHQQALRMLRALMSTSVQNAIEAAYPICSTDLNIVEIMPEHLPGPAAFERKMWIARIGLFVLLASSVIFLGFSAMIMNDGSVTACELIALLPASSNRHPMAIELMNLCILEAMRCVNNSLSYIDSKKESFEQLVTDIEWRTSEYLNGMSKLPSQADPIMRFDSSDVSVVLSTYFSKGRDFLKNSPTMKNSEFIELLTLFNVKVDPTLEEARRIDKSVVDGDLGTSQRLAVILIGIALVLVFCALILDVATVYYARGLVKTCSVLIRHVPTPYITRNADLLNVLLPNDRNEATDLRSICHSVLQHCSTPLIYIGRDFMIDFVNDAYTDVFDISVADLMGTSVKVVIPRPARSDEGIKEKMGAFMLYNDLEEIFGGQKKVRKVEHRASCISNDLYANVEVTAYPVYVQNFVTGIVLVIKEMRELESALDRLRVANTIHQGLKDQLIPPEVTADGPFKLANVTLVAIEISGIKEIIADRLNQFEQFIASIEGMVKRGSSFRVLGVSYNTILLAGGLFDTDRNDAAHVRNAVGLSRIVIQNLTQKAPYSPSGRRWAIAMVHGGPLVGSIVDNYKFEWSGAIIDEVYDFLTMVNDEKILVSASFKKLVDEDHSMKFSGGPLVNGRESYFMERLMLNPLLSQLGDMIRTQTSLDMILEGSGEEAHTARPFITRKNGLFK